MGRCRPVIVALALATLLSLSVSALPDLVIAGMRTQPDQPRAGEVTVIEVTILNQGEDAVEGSFFIRVSIDGHQLAYRSITRDIPAGGDWEFSTDWVPSAGPHEVMVELDPSNDRIDESSEENNTHVEIVNVFLSLESEDTIGSLLLAVGPFLDLTESGFLNVGEGISDKLISRLRGTGIQVIDRIDMESMMQERALNPMLASDVAMAGRWLGSDLVLTGTVMALDVHETSLQLGFLSVDGASVAVRLSGHLVDAHTGETIDVLASEGNDEGATGFSIDLGGFLSLLEAEAPNICGGGLQTPRSWYNVGESIPIAYRNPAGPGWFSIEITTGIGSFVQWLGWRYIDTDDCGVWNWNQLNQSGTQLGPGIYSAKIWDGTAFIAEVGFQIRPGFSLSTPPINELTVGSEAFEETVVGNAINLAVADLANQLIPALEQASPIIANRTVMAQQADSSSKFRVVGQIAALLPDGRLAINIGAMAGVAPGDVFEVLETADVVIDPQTHEVLDFSVLGVKGEILVNDVRERVSYGVLSSDFAPLVGDIVRLIAR